MSLFFLAKNPYDFTSFGILVKAPLRNLVIVVPEPEVDADWLEQLYPSSKISIYEALNP